MAHVIGVPKRDSCQKCELPVFLAERMVVGKKIYHRTCLKCARCHSQLTPGNFYETEIDDEYCCETCPDEELHSDQLLRSQYDTHGTDLRISARSSIAQRLAFFEKSDQSTAEFSEPKNISDEEKSKSLQRLGEAATVSSSAFRMSSAFNDFLNSGANEEQATKELKMADIEDKEGTEEEKSEEDSEETSLTSTPSVLLQSETAMISSTETPQLPVSPSPAEKRFIASAQLDIELEQEQDNLETNTKTNGQQSRACNVK